MVLITKTKKAKLNLSPKKVTIMEDIILKRRQAKSSALFAVSKVTMLLRVQRRRKGTWKTQQVAAATTTDSIE